MSADARLVWRLRAGFTAASLGAQMLFASAAPGFLQFTNLQSWTRTVPDGSGGAITLYTSPLLSTVPAWNELVPSWNMASNAAVTVEIRAGNGDRLTRFYNLGRWSLDTNRFPRTSTAGQVDVDGEVQTDTLVLKAPAAQVQVRLTFHGTNDPRADFRFLGLSLLDTTAAKAVPVPPTTGAWTRTLDVPVRSQADYPEGVQQWCSPTSLTMVLAYHAERRGQRERVFDVPDVARAVFDPGWPGTGNWAFNVAFAGTQPGLRAYVTRLADLREIEARIARELPVIASVSYAMLKGALRSEPGDGHLVVVAGFESSGDVVVNDPGVRRERVRRTILRGDFERAWAHSRNTVYILEPTN